MIRSELLVTLCPSFPHFPQFASDERLAGIRLNSAMVTRFDLEQELRRYAEVKPALPVYFDVKGRQMRVAEIGGDEKHLEIILNHPIRVPMPVLVLFKGATEAAEAIALEDGGRRLVFRSGPPHMVYAGESIHIRHPDLKVMGPIFTDQEKEKIALVRAAGFNRYFLSYVESRWDVEEFQELVGPEAEVWLKIESPAGLRFVQREFRKRDNLTLVAARGDLFVELERPHDILAAMATILAKDKAACAGSRFFLSLERQNEPEACDFAELAWHWELGYRRFMLCDGICLRGDLLDLAIGAFEAFRQDYRPLSRFRLK